MDVKVKAVGRRDEFVNALRAHRAPRPATPSVAAPPRAGPDDPIALLERLAQLHAAGVLTDDEFAAKKAELLGKIG